MNNSLNRLNESLSVLLETEKVGIETLTALKNQTEQISQTRAKLKNTDEEIAVANKSVKRISNRERCLIM